ncbi:hypothetical protein DMUE_1957 [Dictyocoela muelleri]|nr:hypothetical protein DMUE_1957 [Dictyocoela muelleri]
MKVISFAVQGNLNLEKTFVIKNKIFINIPRSLKFPHLTIKQIDGDNLSIKLENIEYLKNNDLQIGNDYEKNTEINCKIENLTEIFENLNVKNFKNDENDENYKNFKNDENDENYKNDENEVFLKNKPTRKFLKYEKLIEDLKKIEKEDDVLKFLFNKK